MLNSKAVVEEREEVILRELDLYKVKNRNNFALCKIMEDVVMQHLGYVDAAAMEVGMENHLSRWEKKGGRQEPNETIIKDQFSTAMRPTPFLDDTSEKRKENFYKEFKRIIGWDSIARSGPGNRLGSGDEEKKSKRHGEEEKIRLFIQAIKNNADISTIRNFLDETPELINCVDARTGLTAIARAILWDKKEIVEFLLTYNSLSLITGHNLCPEAESLAKFFYREDIVQIIGNFKKKQNVYNMNDSKLQTGEEEKDDHGFICPITQEIMEDPVMAADGHSYERKAIESWFTSGKHTSPKTGLQLSNLGLTPNINLKQGISSFKEEKLTVNLDYQYEDNDIQAILASRIKELDLDINTNILAAVDDICDGQLEQRLQADKNNNQGGRIVLIPCNLGNYHWVGISLRFSNNEQLEQAWYVDSFGGTPSENLRIQIKRVYPSCVLRSISSQRQQEDSTSCGAYTVENLALVAQGKQKLNMDAKKIRQLHLKTLKQNNPAFYQSFYERQLHNKSTTASLREQFGYLKKLENIKPDLNGYSRIRDISECIFQMSAPVKAKLWAAFAMGENNDDHRLHLNTIRLALQDVAASLNGCDQELFNTLIRVLFKAKWYPDMKLDDLDFCVHYNEIIGVTEITSMEQLKSFSEKLNKLMEDRENKASNFIYGSQEPPFVEQTNDDKVVALPDQAKCGLCEEPLFLREPLVTCKEIPKENRRTFHQKCLGEYFEKYVLSPNPASNCNISTAYVLATVDEITDQTTCFFSNHRGQAIVNPIKTCEGGEIYQREDFENYIKTVQQVKLWDKFLVTKEMIERDEDYKDVIQKLLDAHGVSEATYNQKIKQQMPKEAYDVYKTVGQLSERLLSVLGKRSDRPQGAYTIVNEGNGKIIRLRKELVEAKKLIEPAYRKPVITGVKTGAVIGAVPLMVGVVHDVAVSARVAYYGAEALALAGEGEVVLLLTSSRFITPAIIGVGIGVVIGVGIGGIVAFAKNKSWEFSDSIQKAFGLFDEAIRNTPPDPPDIVKLEQAEQELRKEFGHGNNGRYVATRAVRWTATEYDQYALAHYVLAEIGLRLQKRDYVYSEFEKAAKDARDINIKGHSLLRLIDLSSNSEKPDPIINGRKNKEMQERKLEMQKRGGLLDEHVKEFNKDCKDVVKNYLNFAIVACISIQNSAVTRDMAQKSIPQLEEILRFDASQFKYVEGGEMLMAAFIFMHGLCLEIFRQNDFKYRDFDNRKLNQVELHINKGKGLSQNQMSTLFAAREKFEECCKLIKRFEPENEVLNQGKEGEILKLMKSFVSSFFEKCKAEKFFSDDIASVIIELGLIENVAMSLSTEQILNVVKDSMESGPDNQADFEVILKQIISSERIARLKFAGGRNWLHYLPRVNVSTNLIGLVQEAAKTVISLGFSPYERDVGGNTAFMCIPKEDPNQMTAIFRPRVAVLADFIGVEREIEQMRNFLSQIKDGIEASDHFILLSGPPGVGKTELVKPIAELEGFTFKRYERGDGVDMWHGQHKKRIQDFFQEAVKSGNPVCLFMDEIDTICHNPSNSSLSAHEDDLVSLIQIMITGLKGTKVVLIGATNYLQKIKQAIQDRIGVSVKFEVPNVTNRQKIIEDKLRAWSLDSNDIITKIAEATAGWSPRRLSSYIRKVINKAILEKRVALSVKDFVESFEPVREDIKKDYKEKMGINVEAPKLKLELDKDVGIYKDLIGLAPSVQKELESLCFFINKPEPYIKAELNDNKNILLYGPPGTGKSSFARAVADKVNAIFINIDGGSYKYPGGGRLLEAVFEVAERNEKAIIFIDEIDAISQGHSDARETLQTRMDGFIKNKNKVLAVIGATNHLGIIARSVRRRFNEVEVPLPSEKQRVELFHYHLEKENRLGRILFSKDLRDNLLKISKSLAEKSKGFSQADIVKALKGAFTNVIDETSRTGHAVPLSSEHVESSVEHIMRSFARNESLTGDILPLFNNHRNQQNARTVNNNVGTMSEDEEEARILAIMRNKI